MNAIIETGGKQYKVAEGDIVFIEKLPAESGDPAKCCVLVDPPRTGLPASLIQDIGWWAPEAVLYVSCAPDTLRRDADRLAARGFRIRSAGMIDMFPATGHFESVTLFGRCA